MINRVIFIILTIGWLTFGVRWAIAAESMQQQQQQQQQELHIDYNDQRINSLEKRINDLSVSTNEITIRVHSDESYVLGATGLFLFFVGRGVFKEKGIQTLFGGNKEDKT